MNVPEGSTVVPKADYSRLSLHGTSVAAQVRDEQLDGMCNSIKPVHLHARTGLLATSRSIRDSYSYLSWHMSLSSGFLGLASGHETG
jgi:hypothetical protein